MEHTFSACESSISQITGYFLKKIKEYKVSEKMCREYELLMEELTTKIILAAEPGAELTLEVKKRLGTISAKIKCPGKPVLLDSESSTDFSGQIIREYSEYLRQSYRFGINEIVFTTSFSSNEILFKNVIALGVAVAVGLLFRIFGDSAWLSGIHQNVSMPVVGIFVRGSDHRDRLGLFRSRQLDGR